MPLWLAAARAVHYSACTGLFGLSLFQLYAHRPPRFRAWLAGLGLSALVSGAAWFALVTVDLAGSLDRPSIAAILANTSFGPVWLTRLALALAVSLYGAYGTPRPRGALSLACALLLGSIALTGHTQTHEGGLRIVHVASDAVHLLGAGAWIGGLIGLALTLTPQAQLENVATVSRFSRMAYVAVAAILVSGLIDSVILIASPTALLTTAYGRLLLVKLALVAAMLGLAAYNRLVLSPALSAAEPAAPGRLRRNVLAEQLLAFGVLVCVACLGMGQPPS